MRNSINFRGVEFIDENGGRTRRSTSEADQTKTVIRFELQQRRRKRQCRSGRLL
jgi:hypothetical protein